MMTGIALETLGVLTNGDLLVRFLHGPRGRVSFGLRVKSGEIEPLSNNEAEHIYESLQKDRPRRRIVESVLPERKIHMRTTVYRRAMEYCLQNNTPKARK